jgi:lauroyl/myristoyl acyltransferase
MSSDKLLFQRDLSRFLQNPVNVFLAKFLPLSIYRQFINYMGFVYYAVHRQEAAIISTSFNQNITKSAKDIYNRSSLNTFRGIFYHYYEKLVTAHRPVPKVLDYLHRQTDVPSRTWIDQLCSNGQGGLFVTGHFGAVEYLPVLLAIKNYRPTMVLRFKTQKLRKSLYERSQKIGLELIDADGANVAQKVINALKRGRILITLCDEFKHWRPSKDNFICILGCSAPRDRTLDVIYRRARVPVCFGLLLRNGKRFTLKIHPIANGRDKLSITDKALEILNQYILEYPDQWYQWQDFATKFKNQNAHEDLYASV